MGDRGRHGTHPPEPWDPPVGATGGSHRQAGAMGEIEVDKSNKIALRKGLDETVSKTLGKGVSIDAEAPALKSSQVKSS